MFEATVLLELPFPVGASDALLISDLSALSDSNGLTDCDIRTRTYVANRLDYLTVIVIILNALDSIILL